MAGITAVTGIRVGHATDREAATGCTVVLCELGATAGVEVRGGAPGTRETDLLDPLSHAQQIHAILLTGGSAFGLAAADGVMRYLEERGIGYDVGVTRIPIVPAAVIFDLLVGSHQVRPGSEMGYLACQVASGGTVEEGTVGAGTGATVGKILGLSGAMKGGVGSFAQTLAGGAVVGAIAVVNAVGDVVTSDGSIIAGTRDPDTGRLLGSAALLRQGVLPARLRENTVIGVVATNVRLSKVDCNRLARVAHHGLAMAVSPSHTTLDGDTFFALSAGALAGHYDAVAAAVPDIVAEAIRRAVRGARGLHGIPGLGDSAAGDVVAQDSR
jgi:L-aminopeptidase/D-esterase-like protein